MAWHGMPGRQKQQSMVRMDCKSSESQGAPLVPLVSVVSVGLEDVLGGGGEQEEDEIDCSSLAGWLCLLALSDPYVGS